MKKFLKVAFVAILAIAVAAPAMADVKVNGYFRTQMQADNVDGVNAAGPNQVGIKDSKTEAGVDQRLRMKVTNALNDNVSVVYNGEVDTPWGSGTSTKYPGGQGGSVGADGVNVETKNAYVAFKVPNSIFDFTVGVQGFNLGFDGVVMFQDAAGVTANMAISDTFGLSLMTAKFSEGAYNASDDVDFYAAQGKFKLGGDNKLAVTGLFINDNANQTDGMGAGVEYNGKFGGVGVNAWLAYSDEEYVVTGAGRDQTGFGASVQAVFGKAAVRATYFTGDDGTGTSGDQFQYDIGNGAFSFYKENLQIMFWDVYYNNLASTGKAMERAEGLMAINAKYDMMMGDMYLKLGAGYFMTAEDVVLDGNPATTDDVLGAEISARIGQKIAEKVDVSLNGAYAMVGDAFAQSAQNDDIYKVNFVINVGF
jgi:hypothetical protein